MPCADGGPSREETELERRFERVMTRLSCDRCNEIEARGGKVPAWAQEWWKAHQWIDNRRLEESAKVRRQREIRNRAVAKLTKEERAELGL